MDEPDTVVKRVGVRVASAVQGVSVKGVYELSNVASAFLRWKSSRQRAPSAGSNSRNGADLDHLPQPVYVRVDVHIILVLAVAPITHPSKPRRMSQVKGFIPISTQYVGAEIREGPRYCGFLLDTKFHRV